MSPSAQSPSGAAAPLPPMSDFGSGSSGASPKDSPLAGIISGLTPIKMSADKIVQECKSIVQSGAVPGAEQVCSQIIALTMSLLPMAAQSMMQPGQGAQAQPGPVGPPPGAPPGPGPVGGIGQQ